MSAGEVRASLPGRCGFALVYALSVGVILLILGGVLFQMVGRHHEEIAHFGEAQVALDLAEAGVGFTIREVRRAFEEGNLGGTRAPLAQQLTEAGPVPGTSIIPLFTETWPYDLARMAGEVEAGSDLQVDAWFERCEAMETDPGRWSDPVAKKGWLAIRSTGTFRGVARTVVVKRPLFAGSMLPPVVTKFSLRVQDGFRGRSDRFNTLGNEYDGRFIHGDRPLVVYNHPLPDDPFSPGAAATPEPDDVFRTRGWVWLGGGPVRLHLTSGAKEVGEIFQLFKVPEPGRFTPIRFTTPADLLPPPFAGALSLPWDCPDGAPERTVSYRFGHDLLLDGFHDQSSTIEHGAMYEWNLLSPSEAEKYGSRASSLHLFGDCRPGFPSRTRVLGNVVTAILRFGRLEVEPQDPEVSAIFGGADPAPMYFLPSRPPGGFDPEALLQDIQGRSVGGPRLRAGDLFPGDDGYAENMCRIVELPTARMYNFMGGTGLPSDQRSYPPDDTPLDLDDGRSLELERGGETLYRGPVSAPGAIDTIRNRVQVELLSVEKFWARYYRPEEGVLRLDTTVRILNPDRQTLVIPPPGFPVPLPVEGAGLLLLEDGDVVCRGERLESNQSALTIVAPRASTVTLEQTEPHQVNLVAHQARLIIGDPCRIYGSVEVGDVLQSPGGKGGSIAWREIQDPTREAADGQDYRLFYRACLGEADGSWHE